MVDNYVDGVLYPGSGGTEYGLKPVDGTYENLVAGTAEAVIGTKGTEDKVPYLFRASNHKSSRMNDKIIGGTVAWNQLCNASSVTVQNGHKYISKKSNAWAVGASTGTALTGYTSGSDMVIDLTQLFGSTIADYIYTLEQTTAGAGVAWFKKLFPKDFYAYNAGELLSVSDLQSHDMVGFNQLDYSALTWTNGTRGDDGTHASSTASHYSSPIRVLPNTKYEILGTLRTETTQFRIYYLTESQGWIERTSSNNLYTNYQFTTPSNCGYIQYQAHKYITLEDACLHVVGDGSRDGEYEPYKKWSYPLDNSLTLRGIPKLDSANELYYDGDVYESDGTVTRKYGIVTLDGTQSILASNFTSGGYVQYLITGIGGAEGKQNGGFISDKYENYYSGKPNTENSINMYYESSHARILIRDARFGSTITSASEWNTWLASNNVTFVYELATPTTESADPYQNPQIVNDFGTEEYVTTSIVPVGHETLYYTDIVGRVEGLPDDFSTLIAPTEKAFKATRAYSKDDFLIINNQLYKVTTSIANGSTITPNTNVRATTIGSELKQIWAYCNQLPDPPVS